jgi:hypothetical protein
MSLKNLAGMKLLNLSSVNLKIEHFKPHYLDDTGKENPQIIENINEILLEIPNHSQPKGGYVWADSNISLGSEHSILVKDKIFNTGKTVFQMLKKSENLCFFLCTAGKGMTEWSRNLFKDGDFLKGYLVDMAGSLIVDLATDKLSEIIEMETAGKGLSFSNRYSPGYCEWDVSEQQKLFSFFPDNSCGVSLSSSSLMIPEKSISGMIGAGKNIKKIAYTCSLCEMKDCIYSKVKKLN